jgi:hypothetical protein
VAAAQARRRALRRAVRDPPGGSCCPRRPRACRHVTSSMSTRCCSGACTCCSCSRSPAAASTSWGDGQPDGSVGHPTGPQPAAGPGRAGATGALPAPRPGREVLSRFDDLFCSEGVEVLVTPGQGKKHGVAWHTAGHRRGVGWKQDRWSLPGAETRPTLRRRGRGSLDDGRDGWCPLDSVAGWARSTLQTQPTKMLFGMLNVTRLACVGPSLGTEIFRSPAALQRMYASTVERPCRAVSSSTMS